MIRNGGALDGVRILAPRTVALMTTNQIGDTEADTGSWLRPRFRNHRPLWRQRAQLGRHVRMGWRLRIELPRRSGRPADTGLHDSADTQPHGHRAEVSEPRLSGSDGCASGGLSLERRVGARGGVYESSRLRPVDRRRYDGWCARVEAAVAAQTATQPTRGRTTPASSARMKVGTQHGDSDAILKVLAGFGVNHICSRLPGRTMGPGRSVDESSRLRERVESFGITLDMVIAELFGDLTERESRDPARH